MADRWERSDYGLTSPTVWQGEQAQFVGTNWRLAMSANETFTHKAFCSRKVNAVHSLTYYVRYTPVNQYVQQMYVAPFSEKGRGFWVERPSLFRKTLDLFLVGSKFPTFLYVLTIFLQMKAHDVLHKTWKVATPVTQSAHDEVGTLLRFSAQIDSLSVAQFCWNKVGLLVGFERFFWYCLSKCVSIPSILSSLSIRFLFLFPVFKLIYSSGICLLCFLHSHSSQ